MTNKFNILFENVMHSIKCESIDITCEICNKSIVPIEEPDFHLETYVDDPASHDHVCQACAEKIYEQYKDKFDNGDFELTEGNNRYDLWRSCEYHSYTALFPESELKSVDDGAMVCSDCIDGAISHGEDISINY